MNQKKIFFLKAAPLVDEIRQFQTQNFRKEERFSLTCINFFAFTDFVIYQGAFKPYVLNSINNFDFNAKETFNNFVYVTINTSFINMYTVFFCFVFIYLIIYLLFNKSLSKH